jgi:hypothetical protein
MEKEFSWEDLIELKDSGLIPRALAAQWKAKTGRDIHDILLDTKERDWIARRRLKPAIAISDLSRLGIFVAIILQGFYADARHNFLSFPPLWVGVGSVLLLILTTIVRIHYLNVSKRLRPKDNEFLDLYKSFRKWLGSDERMLASLYIEDYRAIATGILVTTAHKILECQAENSTSGYVTVDRRLLMDEFDLQFDIFKNAGLLTKTDSWGPYFTIAQNMMEDA